MGNLPNASLSEEMAYVERLLKAPKPERITYLVLTGLSVAILLATACIILLRKPEVATLTTLFGSTGLITYSVGQILKVWTDALKLVAPGGKSDGH
jgi:hypothetical protein